MQVKKIVINSSVQRMIYVDQGSSTRGPPNVSTKQILNFERRKFNSNKYMLNKIHSEIFLNLY
jgi:hypothetical protein